MNKKRLVLVSFLALAMIFTACGKKETAQKDTTTTVATTTTTEQVPVKPAAEFNFNVTELMDALKQGLKNKNASLKEPSARTEKNYEITSTGVVVGEKETNILIYTNLNSEKVIAVQFISPTGLALANNESFDAFITTWPYIFKLAGVKNFNADTYKTLIKGLETGEMQTLETVKGQIVGDNLKMQFVFLPVESELVPKDLAKNK